MKRILFIGHEAERTGAPIVLLHLLRWLKEQHTGIEAEVLLLRDGELREAYARVASVYVVPKSMLPEIAARGLRFLRRKLGLRKRLNIPDLVPFRKDYDLVVGNTVGSLEHLALFKERGLRTVSWIHEMRSVITSFFPEPGRFAEISKSVDLFVVPSLAVETAIRKFGVTTGCEFVPEFSEIRAVNEKESAGVRKALGIPDNAFVVGGCGTVSSRKGTDLFLAVAANLTESINDVYFLWVGGASRYSSAEFDHSLNEIERLGLSRVIITGTQKEPGNYFANMDIFALTSREDPFPLVCLEAASLSKPVICFAGAGGIPEFVGDDAGAVVPFGDVEAFADQITTYYLDRDRLRVAGSAAHRKVSNEFSIDSSCRKLTDLLLDISN